jgi:3-(3-hydroxy-phenyl)propionate hydroxylase
MGGEAPEILLDSYDAERIPAADENIRHSTQATDFITPKNAAARLFRDAALELAREHAFARRLVNSGRLSVPARYEASPLSSADDPSFAGGPSPGVPALDAQCASGGFLLDALKGDFCALSFGAAIDLGGTIRTVCIDADEKLVWSRYDAALGTVYLFRPDQHVCYRARTFDRDAILRAHARALGKEM